MLTPRVRCSVIAFAFALAFLSAGLNAPFTKDQEPQSAQWIVDIVTHGHWLLPYDYYGYVERKPPLFYWLSSLAVIAGGGNVTEGLVRLPSLIAAAALAAETMLWAAGDFGETAGLLAFFFLLGMYGFAARATLVLTDMLMTFLTLTGYRLIKPMDGRVAPRRAVTAGVVLGLGVLTKGPVALVLAALAVAIYLLLMRTNPLGLLRRSWPWMVLAIACAIAALWYVPAFFEGRKSNLAGVFAQENFGHFLPATMGGTGEASRPFYYIALRLIGGTLPLCLLLPALLIALPHIESRAREAIAYQGAMVMAVLLIFSVASAKRDDYILPAIPPLAILLAVLFGGALQAAIAELKFARNWRDATAGLIALVTGLGIVALAAVIFSGSRVPSAGLKLQSADSSFAKIFIDGVATREIAFLSLITAAALGAFICLFGICRRGDSWIGGSLAVIALATTLTWTGLLKPREAATRTVRTFAAEVRDQAGAKPLYLPWQDPEFAYYYGSGVPTLPHAIAHHGPPPGSPIYFVARPTQLFVLAPAVRAHLVPLLRADVLGGGGPPTLYRLNPAS
jgi:4-amino-4-deoxy-L-arabinose transferase-like glycosyltransferase